MGYSCTAAASFTMDAIGKLIGGIASNAMPDGGFYERGREQPDGAMTGTVWASIAGDPNHCRKRGGFRINPDGKVARFPGLNRGLLTKAERMGAKEYKRIYMTSS